jgi:hypothetical protein
LLSCSEKHLNSRRLDGGTEGNFLGFWAWKCAVLLEPERSGDRQPQAAPKGRATANQCGCATLKGCSCCFRTSRGARVLTGWRKSTNSRLRTTRGMRVPICTTKAVAALVPRYATALHMGGVRSALGVRHYLAAKRRLSIQHWKLFGRGRGGARRTPSSGLWYSEVRLRL